MPILEKTTLGLSFSSLEEDKAPLELVAERFKVLKGRATCGRPVRSYAGLRLRLLVSPRDQFVVGSPAVKPARIPVTEAVGLPTAEPAGEL